MKKLALLFCGSVLTCAANAQTPIAATVYEELYPATGSEIVVRTGNTNCHTATAMPIPIVGFGTATYDLIAYTWDGGREANLNWGIAFGELTGGALNACFMNYAYHNAISGGGTLSASNPWTGSDIALVKLENGSVHETYALVSYFDMTSSTFKLDKISFVQSGAVAEIGSVQTYILDHVPNPNYKPVFTHIDAIDNNKFIITYTNPYNHTIHFVTGNTMSGSFVIDQMNSASNIVSATLNVAQSFDDYPDIAMGQSASGDVFTSYTATNTAQNALYVFSSRYFDIAAGGPGATVVPFASHVTPGGHYEMPRIDMPDKDNFSPMPSWSVVVRADYNDIFTLMNAPAQGGVFQHTLNNGSLAGTQILNSTWNFNPVVSYEKDNEQVNYAWCSTDPSLLSGSMAGRFIGMQIDANGNSLNPGYWNVQTNLTDNTNDAGVPSVALSSDNISDMGQLITFNMTYQSGYMFNMGYKIVPWANGSFKPGHTTGIGGVGKTPKARAGISPNPFKGSFSLQISDLAADKKINVAICNIEGKTIHSYDGTVQQINNELSEISTKMAVGAYFVKINGVDINQTIKVVKD